MKILVGYNGSKSSRAALGLAIEHAKAFDLEVLVVTSMEGGSSETAKDVQKANQLLEEARDLVAGESVACTVQQLARGLSPGEDLVRFADSHDVKHIFVGVEKRSRTQKLLLGSTAQYVILKANCPVTTIK